MSISSRVLAHFCTIAQRSGLYLELYMIFFFFAKLVHFYCREWLVIHQNHFLLFLYTQKDNTLHSALQFGVIEYLSSCQWNVSVNMLSITSGSGLKSSQ